MQEKMWNPATGNFIRRTDQPPAAQKSDAWGITIVLDAYSYMVRTGNMKPEDLKNYYRSSSSLYERTDGGRGARIIARQGSEIYVGGDDDLQWVSALVNCYEATKDSLYLRDAMGAFNGLIELGFWKSQPAGWAWNMRDQRPNGVSTSYGALAAARLFQATKLPVYRSWAVVALTALQSGGQVAFIPRDQMVAAEAAALMYQETHEEKFRTLALTWSKHALTEIELVLTGKQEGERNPTDAADLAEGFAKVALSTKSPQFLSERDRLLRFFFTERSNDDIKANGFYSRYLTSGKPDLSGAYLGVPCTAQYLPEVAEMLKLEAEMVLLSK